MTIERKPGMSMIVRTVTRWLKGPILLFGIYIVLYGHITPGGGFGGGGGFSGGGASGGW